MRSTPRNELSGSQTSNTLKLWLEQTQHIGERTLPGDPHRKLTDPEVPQSPTQFTVGGLPPGQSALINKTSTGWHIMYFKTHQGPAAWEGDYASPEDALAALAEHVTD